MVNFDDMLRNLHGNASLVDKEIDTPIVINANRIFEVPKEYNLTLAYVGDVNSQIVTFKIPRYHEGHDLSQCQNKKLKWKNQGNKAEGNSTLTAATPSDGDETFVLSWMLPPAAMAAAGKLEIAISLYDIDNGIDGTGGTGRIGFSWNTPVYSGFKIGESLTDVGTPWEEDRLPAKNETLLINVEARSIIAPSGYNGVIANFGDIGTSKVFFQTNRIIRGMDLLDNGTEVSVNVTYMDDLTASYEIKNINSVSANKEQVIICWDVPAEITNNNQYYFGNIAISLTFKQGNTKRWTTSAYTGLSISKSLLETDVTSIAARDEEIVENAVDEYMTENYFVISPDD